MIKILYKDYCLIRVPTVFSSMEKINLEMSEIRKGNLKKEKNETELIIDF